MASIWADGTYGRIHLFLQDERAEIDYPINPDTNRPEGVPSGSIVLRFDERTNATLVTNLIARRDDFSVDSEGVLRDGSTVVTPTAPSNYYTRRESALGAISALMQNTALTNTQRDDLLWFLAFLAKRNSWTGFPRGLYPAA